MDRSKLKFLELLKETKGSVIKSCEAMGVSAQVFYRWRAVDKLFAYKADNIRQYYLEEDMKSLKGDKQ